MTLRNFADKFYVILSSGNGSPRTNVLSGEVTSPTQKPTLVRPYYTILIGVSNSLNCTRFPFVAIIANIPSPTPTSPSQMTLLARIEGPVPATQLISSLAAAVTRTLPQLNRRRALKREQEAARELRRMQDEAYSNSLAQDRAREEQVRIAQLESERLEREFRERAQIIERKALSREQWREWKAHDLQKRGLVGMRNETGKTARVSLRLAEGERIVQIFPGEMGVEEVYAFVECYDLLFPSSVAEVTLSSTGGTVEGEFEKPEDYEHEYKFRLVVQMPRKVIESGRRRIRDEGALWPSGSIMVETIEDDTESEAEDSEDQGL
jgi:FAS-associated factor 2